MIAVMGASSGAGATYVSTALALEVGKAHPGTAYLETNCCDCPACVRKPPAFYEMNLYRRISPRRFSDFFYLKLAGESTDNRVNLYRGVNWVVRSGQSPCCLIRPEEVSGDYVIWDNPPEDKTLMSDADLILCVIDSRLSHVMAGAERAKELMADYLAKTRIVFNGADKRAELARGESYIGRKGDFFISREHGAEDIKKIAEYIIALY